MMSKVLDRQIVRRVRNGVAQILVLALITSLPRPVMAAWKDLSGTLPGTGISTPEKIGIGVTGAALTAVVVLVIVKHKRSRSESRLNPPYNFQDAAQPGLGLDRKLTPALARASRDSVPQPGMAISQSGY